MPKNILFVSTLIAFLIASCGAQSPARVPAPASKARPASAAAPSQHPVANLSQLMKGILYPASNVIFAAQSTNPADVKPAADPAMATNPLASTYGKWQAVENSRWRLSKLQIC